MEALRELARGLRREAARTVLTAMGLALGAASVVFLASTLASAEIALDRMSQEASGADVMHVRRETANAPPSRTTRALGEADARALAAHDGLEQDAVIASRTVLARTASAGRSRTTVGVQSGGTPLARATGLELARGRWLDPGEDGRRTCMIGHDVWMKLFGGQWPLPMASLTLDDGTTLAVVGVLGPRPAPGAGGGEESWKLDRRVWVSTTTFARSIDAGADADDIMARYPTRDGAPPDLAAIAAALTPYLTGLHRGVVNFSFDAADKAAQLGLLVVTALGGILFSCGFVAMIVGGVNVMNAELVRLQERTKELAIRRALGLSARRLMREVLLDTCVLALVAGGVGVALGLLGAWLVSAALSAWLTPWPLRIAYGAIPVALGASLGAGLLAGWLPARRAASIVPSTCLAQG